MSRYINADRLEECMRIVKKANKDSVEFNKRCRATDVFLDIWDMIKEQPTADVLEKVHGEWSPRTNLPKQEIFICSVCGGWAYSPWIGSRKNPKPNWCKYKYCPNCGAKMDERRTQ